jgi:two-component system, sensor histidine kinase and response regulator
MKQILIIDDDQAIRKILRKILISEGFTILEAEDGEEGINLSFTHLPDLIICDILMPRVNGYTVIEKLRNNPNTVIIPFIFLTAKATDNNIRKGMNLGADDYLTKPFSREELLTVINTRLDKHNKIKQYYQQEIDDLRQSISLSIPHELRTPLTGILGSCSFLLDSFESLDQETVIEMLEAIKISSKRLYELIQKYLIYTQLELTIHDFDKVEQLQKNTVESARYYLENIAIQQAQIFNREPDLSLEIEDACLKIDGQHLQQLVIELVNNAFKFSKFQTPIKITGSLQGKEYWLLIIDQGRGMTAEQINKVGAYMQFKRDFYEQQGAGLGLIIAKRIAEFYHGLLQIESVVGESTRVKVKFSVVS